MRGRRWFRASVPGGGFKPGGPEGAASEWSEPAQLEMGLLTSADWEAAWIRPESKADPAMEAVAYLRREFALPDRAERARLYVTYPDGSVRTVLSDDQWKATWDGPVRSSSLYDGETYDARKEMPGWDQPGFDDAQWRGVAATAELGAARLVPKPFATVRAMERLTTQAITEPESGRPIFDLGQNMVGLATLDIPVEKDRTVTIRFAEMLNQDGTMYTENYRSAKTTD